MTFTEYLISKKINEAAFQKSEPALFLAWKTEFEQIHPNSFTVQKLNLINPIRRKYTLSLEEAEKLKPVEKPKPVVKVAIPRPAAPKTAEETKALTVEATKADEPVKTEEPPSTESSENKTPSPSPAKPARPVFKPKPKLN